MKQDPGDIINLDERHALVADRDPDRLAHHLDIGPLLAAMEEA